MTHKEMDGRLVRMDKEGAWPESVMDFWEVCQPDPANPGWVPGDNAWFRAFSAKAARLVYPKEKPVWMLPYREMAMYGYIRPDIAAIRPECLAGLAGGTYGTGIPSCPVYELFRDGTENEVPWGGQIMLDAPEGQLFGVDLLASHSLFADG